MTLVTGPGRCSPGGPEHDYQPTGEPGGYRCTHCGRTITLTVVSYADPLPPVTRQADLTSEQARRIRAISEQLGQQCSHLVTGQLVSHAQSLLEVTRGVKTDKGVHARLARRRIGRGANRLSGNYGWDTGVATTRFIDAITELRSLVAERPPVRRRRRNRA